MRSSSNILNKTDVAWFPLFVVCLVFSLACNNSKSAEIEIDSAQIVPPSALENRFDEVRAIHDEVMPERGRLIRLQRTIAKAELDLPVSTFVQTRLERADDMMMNWMYADLPLNKLVDSLDESSIYRYLDAREKEIIGVSDSMMVAIQFAESILAQ